MILEDTPADYFPAYMAAAKATLEKNAKENAFFKEVYDSMISFANTAVPFWSGAQTSNAKLGMAYACLLYTSPSPRDLSTSRMPSSA